MTYLIWKTVALRRSSNRTRAMKEEENIEMGMERTGGGYQNRDMRQMHVLESRPLGYFKLVVVWKFGWWCDLISLRECHIKAL